MTTVAISQLPVALAAQATDDIPIVQNGITKRLTNTLLFTNSTLVTPVLGTPASGTLTNCTGLPIVNGTTGVLTVARGGTGASVATGTGDAVLATSPTLITATFVGVQTFGGPLVEGAQALTGPGAVNITQPVTKFTSTGTGDALTLADSAEGQLKTIVYVAETAGADTGVLTPANLGAGTTITFTNVGDACVLQFLNAAWWAISLRGATLA